MKKLFLMLLTYLFLLGTAYSQGGFSLTGSQTLSTSSGSATFRQGCYSNNDITLQEWTATVVTSNNGLYAAHQFTTTATKYITGGYFMCKDNGETLMHSATLEIWTNDAGSPGVRLGDGFTATLADLSDYCVDTEFLFSTPQILPAGTYWLVWFGDLNAYYCNGMGGGSGWKYTADPVGGGRLQITTVREV